MPDHHIPLSHRVELPPAVEQLLDGYFTPVTLCVQWGEMDAFQHVNNVTYIRWIETARMRLFLDSGVMTANAPGRFGPIQATMDCRYRRPVEYPDTVTLGSRIGAIREHDFFVETRVVSHVQQALVTEATVRIVWMDYSAGTKAGFPDELRRSLTRYRA